MKGRRTIMVAITAVLLLAGSAMFRGPAYAAVLDSGTCGADLIWTLTGTDECLLTIQGSGAMYNYNGMSNPAPWYNDREKITQVRISDGVTSIGDYAFITCWSLADIDIPESVTTIGSCAFMFCTELTEIHIPEGVTAISDSLDKGSWIRGQTPLILVIDGGLIC